MEHYQKIRSNPAKYGTQAMARWPELQPVQWASINGDHEALAKHLSGVYGRDMTQEVDDWARGVTGITPSGPMTTEDVKPKQQSAPAPKRTADVKPKSAQARRRVVTKTAKASRKGVRAR